MEGHPAEIREKSTNYILNNVVILILLMLPTVSIVPQVTEASVHLKASPCCSFPCRNGGACMEVCGGYRCDCTGTNHYGKNCQSENFGYKLKKLLRAGATLLGLTDAVDMMQYEPKFSRDHGGFGNENFNICPEPMLLSPVPEHCPTPLGIAGFQILPPVEILFDLVLKRKCSSEHTTTTNLLFVVFAQFLANQMWQCSNSNWLGSAAMYGNYARTGLRGKVIRNHNEQHGNIYQNLLTDVFQSIVLQEHNRLCQILSQENPKWNDQRLFDTATLIVTGQILTIAAKEWLPLLQDFGGSNAKLPYIVLSRVPKEMKLAFFWPQTFPDSVQVEGVRMDLGMLMNSKTSDLPRGGHYQLMKIAAMTVPEKMGPQNVPRGLEDQTKMMITEGRRWKFQSYNNYREYLGLGRLSSFSKLTGNDVVKKNLKNMYGDVNGLELITGLLLETPRKGQLLGETTIALISNTIFKAVVTHPLNTVPFKKKFTFGGKTGWNIVKNAKIQTLVCNNVCDKRLCEKEGMISFKNKKVYQNPQPFKPSKVGHIQRTVCKGPAKPDSCRKPKKCSVSVKRKCSKDPKKDIEPPCKEILQNPLEKSPCIPKTPEPNTVCPVKAKDQPTYPQEPKTCPTKRCCIKRPWYRKFTSKPGYLKPAKSQCDAKPKCVLKNVETGSRLEPKMETPCEPKVAPKKCCAKRSWYRAWQRG